jgi:hypothetical protein
MRPQNATSAEVRVHLPLTEKLPIRRSRYEPQDPSKLLFCMCICLVLCRDSRGPVPAGSTAAPPEAKGHVLKGPLSIGHSEAGFIPSPGKL